MPSPVDSSAYTRSDRGDSGVQWWICQRDTIPELRRSLGVEGIANALDKSAVDSEGWRARGIDCFSKFPEWIETPADSGQSIYTSRMHAGGVKGCRMWIEWSWG